MKRNVIKSFLFSLAGVITMPVFAGTLEADDLVLVENLPVEQRAIVHNHILKYFMMNPELAQTAKAIALDQEGKVYVLDENKVIIFAAGNPSCAAAN